MKMKFTDEELAAMEYPDDTIGARLARENRIECNKLTSEERDALFRAGMRLIYADPEPKEKDGL